tara:strand:- start:384 stop:584 length:201 start_codon:yes stop_codon:yes gene_type:complete
VETIANPYLDKLSLKKNNIGKKKNNNCDLGLSLMETEKSNFKQQNSSKDKQKGGYKSIWEIKSFDN